jgi:VanZ family protein
MRAMKMRPFQGNTRLRLIFGIITAAIMVMIFVFSAEDGSRSGADSAPLTEMLVSRIVHDYALRTPAEKSALLELASFFVRKAAHMFEYMLLGCFMTLFYETLPFRYPVIKAGLTCVLYACTDELHQMLVPGRSAQFVDVMFDSVGTFVGVCIGLFIVLLYAAHQQQSPKAVVLRG